jgi:predicted 2-oxoglutarate/Fe(II)-dependent dioxygenase YbiX
MTDTIERTTKEIRDRLKELEPLVEEQRRLQRALEALEKVDGRRTRGQSTRGRLTSGTRTRRTPRRRARRGERREELLKAIRENPGSRPADLARTIGVPPSQAHSLLRRLQEDKEVERRAGGLFARTGASSDSKSEESP